jgi:hypothetical protein
MYIYIPHCLSSERKRYLFCDVLGETLESTWPRRNDVRIHVKNKREIVVDFLNNKLQYGVSSASNGRHGMEHHLLRVK